MNIEEVTVFGCTGQQLPVIEATLSTHIDHCTASKCIDGRNNNNINCASTSVSMFVGTHFNLCYPLIFWTLGRPCLALPACWGKVVSGPCHDVPTPHMCALPCAPNFMKEKRVNI